MRDKKSKDCWQSFPRSTPRNIKFEVRNLDKIYGKDYVYEAPDGSRIIKFQDVRYGGLCHAIFPPQSIAKSQKHKTVDEIWYCIQGNGKIWIKKGKTEKISKIKAKDGFNIPSGTHFQVRNDSKEPLIFVIATMPPWPGASEAIRVVDHWKRN